MESLIPETAAQALEKWDKGESVFTVSMGGLGPGYEQVIHILAFEFIREFKDRDWSREWAKDELKALGDEMDEWAFKAEFYKKLGPSGAQHGAARQMAYQYMQYGYRHMVERAPKDRLIQVSKFFPQVA